MAGDSPPQGVEAASKLVGIAMMVPSIDAAKEVAKMITEKGWGFTFQFAEKGPCGICVPVFGGLKLGAISYFDMAKLSKSDWEEIMEDDDEDDDDLFDTSWEEGDDSALF